MRASLALLAVCTLLVACGQRGDLYLPGQPREVVSTPATTGNPSGAATDEEAEERRRQESAAGPTATN